MRGLRERVCVPPSSATSQGTAVRLALAWSRLVDPLERRNVQKQLGLAALRLRPAVSRGC